MTLVKCWVISNLLRSKWFISKSNDESNKDIIPKSPLLKILHLISNFLFVLFIPSWPTRLLLFTRYIFSFVHMLLWDVQKTKMKDTHLSARLQQLILWLHLSPCLSPVHNLLCSFWNWPLSLSPYLKPALQHHLPLEWSWQRHLQLWNWQSPER